MGVVDFRCFNDPIDDSIRVIDVTKLLPNTNRATGEGALFRQELPNAEQLMGASLSHPYHHWSKAGVNTLKCFPDEIVTYFQALKTQASQSDCLCFEFNLQSAKKVNPELTTVEAYFESLEQGLKPLGLQVHHVMPPTSIYLSNFQHDPATWRQSIPYLVYIGKDETLQARYGEVEAFFDFLDLTIQAFPGAKDYHRLHPNLKALIRLTYDTPLSVVMMGLNRDPGLNEAEKDFMVGLINGSPFELLLSHYFAEASMK